MARPPRDEERDLDSEELRHYALMHGYASAEQMYQLREDFGADKYDRIAEHVSELYEQGDIAGLEFLYRDLYDEYRDEYGDELDDLNDLLHGIVSPSAE
jgi:hypothetical protein